jgi:tRNA (uracil-5-)-methyltransferase TRM9
VWAIEQDEFSKRTIPTDGDNATGQDVVVPWVLSTQNGGGRNTVDNSEPQVFNRYYHMFARGELAGLVQDAANDLGIYLGPPPSPSDPSIVQGIEMVQDGWERSNYYVELRYWELS